MSRVQLLLALLPLCTGCFVHHPIRAEQLAALDGYSPERQVQGPLEPSTDQGRPQLRAHLLPPGTLRLQDTSGEWFDFVPESILALEGSDRVFPSGRVLSARFDQNTLHARLEGDAPLEAPIESIRSAEMNQFSVGRTIAFGIGLGMGTLLVLVMYGLANFHCHC